MPPKLSNALWNLYIVRGYWNAVAIVSAETRIPREIIAENLDQMIDSKFA